MADLVLLLYWFFCLYRRSISRMRNRLAEIDAGIAMGVSGDCIERMIL